MQNIQKNQAHLGNTPPASPIEMLLANGEDVIITLNELFSSNDFDEAPSEVDITLTTQSVWALRKAAETMERNPCFGAISVNAFDWDVSEDYDGKARQGKLELVRTSQSFDIHFTFINDWSYTRFSAYLDCLDVKDLLSAPMKAG